MLSALAFYVIINGQQIDRFQQTYKSENDCNAAIRSIYYKSDYDVIQIETACEDTAAQNDVHYNTITPLTGFRLVIKSYTNEGKSITAPRLPPIIYKDMLACTGDMMKALKLYKAYGRLMGVCLPPGYYTEIDKFQ